jgi:hypothetical protein
MTVMCLLPCLVAFFNTFCNVGMQLLSMLLLFKLVLLIVRLYIGHSWIHFAVINLQYCVFPYRTVLTATIRCCISCS